MPFGAELRRARFPAIEEDTKTEISFLTTTCLVPQLPGRPQLRTYQIPTYLGASVPTYIR